MQANDREPQQQLRQQVSCGFSPSPFGMHALHLVSACMHLGVCCFYLLKKREKEKVRELERHLSASSASGNPSGLAKMCLQAGQKAYICIVVNEYPEPVIRGAPKLINIAHVFQSL